MPRFHLVQEPGRRHDQDDSQDGKKKPPYPISVVLIILTEFGERFSFFGLTGETVCHFN
jgi:dipeptide/tripeptide permease